MLTLTLRSVAALPDVATATATLGLHQLPLCLAGWHGRLPSGTAIECTLRNNASVATQRRNASVATQRRNASVATQRRNASVATQRRWDRVLLRDVFEGAGFADIRFSSCQGVLTVRATRQRTLADRVSANMRLLVCGLNPSLYAADAGVAFARPGNRFWPALLGAGLVERDRDPDAALDRHGIGFTDLVKRATRAAEELDETEFRLGASRVERLVGWLQPGVVCFFGVTGYRVGVDRKAKAGVLPAGFAGRPAMLLGNPSGLNAHCRLDDLVAALRGALDLAVDAPYGPA